MSLLLWASAALVIGLCLGPLLIIGLAPVSNGVAKWLAKQGIRGSDGWVLKPVGGVKYELEPVEYDDTEGRAWRIGDDDDDDREYYDDNAGKMRTLFGRSFGLVVEDVSSVVDPIDCKLGDAEGQKSTDGGQLDQDASAVLEDMQDEALVGSVTKEYKNGVKQRIDYVNPFVEVEGSSGHGTIVDVRDAVTLLAKNGSPETPRKTAENAAQAERAFEDWGEMKRNASLMAAFIVGAIVTEFIAGGGGGGGGGGINVGLSLARPLMDMGAVLLGVA